MGNLDERGIAASRRYRARGVRRSSGARDDRGCVPAGHARRAESVRRLPGRRRAHGADDGDAGRGHHVRGRVPSLQLLLHRAALHAPHAGPGRVAERGAAAVRGHRRRPADGIAAVPRRDRAASRARGAGSVPCQPRARDARLDRGRADGDRRHPRRGDADGLRPDRARRGNLRGTGSARAQRSAPLTGRRTREVGQGPPGQAPAERLLPVTRSTACGSKPTKRRWVRLGDPRRATPASPIPRRRASSPRRPTRSARRSPRIGSRRSRAPRRSRARATL